jgi:hypothetical protein
MEEQYQRVTRAFAEFHHSQHAEHVWDWYQHDFIRRNGCMTYSMPIPAEAKAYVLSKAS